MTTNYSGVVNYELVLDNASYALNEKIGSFIDITFLGNITCQACGKGTNKSYNQGFCYICFKRLARNDQCIMSPHLCHYAKGTCREPEWGLAHCMQKHIIYIAWSSNLKVGLTKPSQIPIRWMDQGASHAVAICEVSSRFHAGIIEKYLSQWYSDRTNWRKMLLGETLAVDMLEKAEEVQGLIKQGEFTDEVKSGIQYLDPKVFNIEYPIDSLGPIQSLSLDKQKQISGHLLGIRGQYLILDTGVINIRKHGSYAVTISFEA